MRSKKNILEIILVILWQIIMKWKKNVYLCLDKTTFYYLFIYLDKYLIFPTLNRAYEAVEWPNKTWIKIFRLFQTARDSWLDNRYAAAAAEVCDPRSRTAINNT